MKTLGALAKLYTFRVPVCVPETLIVNHTLHHEAQKWCGGCLQLLSIID